MSAAIVLLSGGLDSTVALHWAIRCYGQPLVRALSFDYGQRHGVELSRAAEIARQAGVPHRVQEFAAPLSYLTGRDGDPSTSDVVVPARNTLMLSLAAAEAVSRGAHVIVIGCCADDAAVFPDCRPAYLDAMTRVIDLGVGSGMKIVAPLVHKTKREIVALGRELGCDAAMALSWSCYDPQFAGARTPLECGRCMACAARARGFAEAV